LEKGDSENTNSPPSDQQTQDKESKSADEKPTNSESNPKQENKEQTSQENKKDVDSLRTVIKVNEGNSSGEKTQDEKPVEEKKEGEKPSEELKVKPGAGTLKLKKDPQTSPTQNTESREDLEQKRNLLQSIKDFDFKIKKNQEDIGKLVEKYDSLTKDLDDLVSLYEIVSEQMNPFVGLSKVTKKRIDALESYTREIESVKDRVGNIESILENGNISSFELKDEKISTVSKKVDGEIDKDGEKSEIKKESDIKNNQEIIVKNDEFENLSDIDLENIINDTFNSIIFEQRINSIIDEFFLNLK